MDDLIVNSMRALAQHVAVTRSHELEEIGYSNVALAFEARNFAGSLEVAVPAHAMRHFMFAGHPRGLVPRGNRRLAKFLVEGIQVNAIPCFVRFASTTYVFHIPNAALIEEDASPSQHLLAQCWATSSDIEFERQTSGVAWVDDLRRITVPYKPATIVYAR